MPERCTRPPLNPADLEQAGLSAEEIAQLDEASLSIILRRTIEHLQTDVFWDEVIHQARDYLDTRQET